MIQGEEVDCILIDLISLYLSIIMLIFPLSSIPISHSKERNGQNRTHCIDPSVPGVSNIMHSGVPNLFVVTIRLWVFSVHSY